MAGNYEPTFDWVMVKAFEEKDRKSKGGILLPETASANLQTGTVVGVGPGRRTKSGARVPVEVKVGDTVLFNVWAQSLQTNDGEMFLIAENDLLGLLEQ